MYRKVRPENLIKVEDEAVPSYIRTEIDNEKEVEKDY